jgi:hypothetical protein
VCELKRCSCGCNAPTRQTNAALKNISDQRLADDYRRIRSEQQILRDELLARGYKHEIKTGSRWTAVRASTAAFRWRKLVVIEPEETILS